MRFPSAPAGVAFVCAVLAPVASSQIDPSAVMVRTPDISATSIVFRYADDLWLVPKTGGVASRVTSDPGPESFPRFSPDGSKIAYRAQYDGQTDLYVMDLGGGAPRRVTFHSENELLCDWTPDGEGLIYFSRELSGNPRQQRLFVAPIDGGQPDVLPVPYGTFGAIDPTGEWLAYTPRTTEFSTWKRYQGGLATDVWLFNLNTNESRKVTEHLGNDGVPMWYGDRLVFLSDRGEPAVVNLWGYDTGSGDFTQLTHFTEFDVKFPSIGPEDVVFENGGRLWRLSMQSGATEQVDVRIPGDRPALRATAEDVSSLLGTVAPGPSGVRAMVEARGEIFDVPFGDGVTRNLTRTSGVAERAPSWSPDGRWVVYFSDRSGDYEATLRRADGKDFDGADENGERRLTSLGAGYRYGVNWAPDSEKFTIVDHDGTLRVCWVEDGRVEQLATGRSGQPLGGDWSPDSNWIVWSDQHPESRLGAIYITEVDTGETTCVTSGLFNDSDPAFGADGDWLFYSSSQVFSPTYADLDTTWIYEDTLVLIGVPLRDDVELPFAPSDPEEEIEEDEEPEEDAAESAEGEDAEGDEDADGEASDEDASEEAGDGEESSDDEGEEDDDRVEIDLEGFEARAVRLETGSIRNILGSKSGPAYLRSGDSGSDLVVYDLEDEEETTVMSGVSSFRLLPGRDKALVRAGGKWGVISMSPGASIDDALDTSSLFALVDPREEWSQILDEAWRLCRDFFYEPTMHGVDWDAMRDRYRAALPDVTTRSDLSFLIGELISELNVGHAYNRPNPGASSPRTARPVGLLGCDWELADGHYRIARILGGHAAETDARSPLSIPGIDVNEGDYLLAVNGIEVDASRAIYAAFEGTAGKATWITVNASPAFDGEEREVLVEPVRSERSLRYRDWIRRNREHVHAMTDGRVGYVHVPDTGVNGQNELVRQYFGQAHCDALIIDERWNGGGQIPTRFIELLDRPLTNFWAVRNGEDWDWPPDGFHGPKCMLINNDSGSGGDAFPYYFRQAGLGKLIGRRTWGGLVGISGNPTFVDGSGISVPRFAFYELDGTWGVEGYGVAPDIDVVDDPALMVDGGDPQLDAAIEHMLEELRTWPPIPRNRPTSPDRSGAGLAPGDQ